MSHADAGKAVAISLPKFRHSGLRLYNWALVALAVTVLAIAIAVWKSSRSEQSEQKVSGAPQGASIPLASSPRSQWLQLTIPPNGKSERIPVPQQMTPEIGGNSLGSIRVHCVYGDGHEESFGFGESPCPKGDMPFVYVTNMDTRNSAIISYAYAPIR